MNQWAVTIILYHGKVLDLLNAHALFFDVGTANIFIGMKRYFFQIFSPEFLPWNILNSGILWLFREEYFGQRRWVYDCSTCEWIISAVFMICPFFAVSFILYIPNGYPFNLHPVIKCQHHWFPVFWFSWTKHFPLILPPSTTKEEAMWNDVLDLISGMTNDPNI